MRVHTTLVTFRAPRALRRKLRAQRRTERRTEGAILRDALTRYFENIQNARSGGSAHGAPTLGAKEVNHERATQAA